jgi:hypothetical protein
MNLTEQEAAKMIEELEAHLRSIRAVWSKADDNLREDLEALRGETFAALAILAVAKDRPQPAVDGLTEAEVFQVCEDYADNYQIEGRITVQPKAMRIAVENMLRNRAARSAAPVADEPHIHTVYDAVGGGYICSGCEMRFAAVDVETVIGVVDAHKYRVASSLYVLSQREIDVDLRDRLTKLFNDPKP